MAGEDFGDVDGFRHRASAAEEAAEMHEAGHVGAGDELSAVAEVIGDAVAAHGEGDVFFEDGEGAAEAAAFIGTVERDELQARDSGEQGSRFGEVLHDAFAGAGEVETAQPVAALVKADAVGETCG